MACSCCIIEYEQRRKIKALYEITTKQEFEEKVVKNSKPVLVDFWAPWCPPCRAMAPILHQIAEETEFDVVKVDTEASQENVQLAMDYRVQGIPNMKVFVGGEIVEELIGMKPKQTLIDALEKAAK